MIPTTNLWRLTALLAISVFSGACVRESLSFFATTDHVRSRRSIAAGDSFSRRANSPTPPSSQCAQLSPSPSPLPSSCSRSRVLASTVVDNPTKTEIVEEKKINDKAENEAKSSGKDEWEIQLFNDPHNRRNFVAKCLCQICGKSDVDSYRIMMKAHSEGMGVVGHYPYEIAEMYYGSLQAEGLWVRMVQIEDE